MGAVSGPDPQQSAMNPRRTPTLLLAAALLAAGPAAAARKPAAKPAAPAKEAAPAKDPAKPAGNDFPTLARVEYVLQCMNERGGQNYNNLYHCVCAADKIAASMNYQEFSEALTFTYMFDTPGEKGGEFRDPPKSKELREKLKAARKEAEVCFPPKPEAAAPAAPAEPVKEPAPAAGAEKKPEAPPEAAPAPAPSSGRGRPENPRRY
jgi:hypothetical protein